MSARRSLVFAFVLLGGLAMSARAQGLAPAPSPSPSLAPRIEESVVVEAVRAGEGAPVTTAELPRAELERGYHGQEMPVLLAQTPSIVQYSETGNGAGYSYFFLRGLHQSRVNMTLDGVPLNDPEESAVFFANFGDFGSALESVQVQRGVGTSSVGAASFAGSVNFESASAFGARQIEIEGGLGSWGSSRGSAALRSGTLGNGVSLFARGSLLGTDGYRERSGVAQRAVYLGGARQGEASLLKVFSFLASEETQLAFVAPDAQTLAANPRANVMADGETDGYRQDFLQAHYSRLVGTGAVATLQGYTSGARGAFRLFDDPASRETLRSYGLDGRTVGALSTLSLQRGAGSLITGVHLSRFSRDHFQDVVEGARTYTNAGHKNELAAFVKVSRGLGRLQLYSDAQVRHASFRFTGAVLQAPVSWTFFNPKVGARARVTELASVYASVGRSSREPARNDLFSGEDDPTLTYDMGAVRPERVTDVEAGFERRGRRLFLKANVYAMEFRQEIVATGELSVAGFPLRRNAPRSYRRGVELDAGFQVRPGLRVGANGSASHDRLHEWTQFFDVYTADGAFLGQEQREYRDVRPLLTPPFTANARIDWTRAPVEIGASVRRVGRLHLDNTADASLSAPAWTSVDARGVLDLSFLLATGAPRLRVEVTNLLDRRIHASGYSYLFLTRSDSGDVASGTAYFYPLASRSVHITLQARF